MAMAVVNIGPDWDINTHTHAVTKFMHAHYKTGTKHYTLVFLKAFVWDRPLCSYQQHPQPLFETRILAFISENIVYIISSFLPLQLRSGRL